MIKIESQKVTPFEIFLHMYCKNALKTVVKNAKQMVLQIKNYEEDPDSKNMSLTPEI